MVTMAYELRVSVVTPDTPQLHGMRLDLRWGEDFTANDEVGFAGIGPRLHPPAQRLGVQSPMVNVCLHAIGAVYAAACLARALPARCALGRARPAKPAPTAHPPGLVVL